MNKNDHGQNSPSAALKVLLLFLIPIAVFIVTALAISRFLPALVISDHDIAPIVQYGTAFLLTLGAVYLTRFMIRRHLDENK